MARAGAQAAAETGGLKIQGAAARHATGRPSSAIEHFAKSRCVEVVDVPVISLSVSATTI